MADGSGGRIASIWRYPVKGLTPEQLAGVRLAPGETLPFDRAFAIENGAGAFDENAPRYLPKTAFLMLQRDERLATLRTQFAPESGMLTVLRNGRQVARGNLNERIGRQMIEQFLAAFMADALRGPPRIVHAGGHSFSDVPAKVVSIVSLASLRDLERVAGRALDPLRFRANIYVEGLPAWAEFGWLDRTIGLGGEVRLQVLDRIRRCAATNVDPATGARDGNIPRTLTEAFGHADFGIYAKVLAGGGIATGTAVVPPA